MKKLILVLICISFGACVMGQVIFNITEPAVEQKHKGMVSSFWSHLAPGILFAKNHNVSPYEYGTYYGRVFAESRISKRDSSGSEASFIDFAQGHLNSWLRFLTESDPKIRIEKESDSLLIYKVPSSAILNYFGAEGLFGVSAEEMLQMINGSHEQISKDYGCTSTMVLEGEWIVGIVKKN